MQAPKVETFELPFGQECLWFPEWNTIAFAPHLDAEGRRRVLEALQVEWRQRALTGVTPAA